MPAIRSGSRPGVGLEAGSEHLLDIDRVGRIDLVDDQEVRDSEVGFTRVVGQLVTGPVRIHERDVQVRAIKGRIVVATIPQDHVGFLFGLANDHLVVDTGVNDKTVVDVGLVLLALFDRAAMAIEVLVGLETLAGLLGKIAVGHGVANRDNTFAHFLEDARNIAGGLRFADAGSDGGNRDDRFG